MYAIGIQVRYHGSIEWLYGETFTITAYDPDFDRYRLDGYYSLTHVRHESITPIDGSHPDDVVDAETEAEVRRAITAQNPLMITYIAADGEWTTRTIEPYEVAETRAGRTIVRAMDRRSGDPRSFRVDRIHHVNVLTGTFQLERPAPVHRPARRAALAVVGGTDREAVALERIRAEIRQVASAGYGDDAMRWTPDCPVL
jgi:predicted DNA-binding transcriptional regulator YafY